jgi:hypothetical protein
LLTPTLERILARGFTTALLALLVACESQDDGARAPTAPTIARSDAGRGQPLPLALPAGTTFHEDTASDGSKRLIYILPSTHRLIAARRVDGDLRSSEEFFGAGELICTCEKGKGGCSPFRLPTDPPIIGCAQNTCDRCVGENRPARLVNGAWVSEPADDVDIIDVSRGIALVSEVAEAESLRCARAPFMLHPAILDSIDRHTSEWLGRDDRAALREARVLGTLPADYELVPLAVYGRLIRVPMRRASTIHQSLMDPRLRDRPSLIDATPTLAAMPSSEVICRCHQGTSGCVYKRRFIGIGYAEWCEAYDCSQCGLEYRPSTGPSPLEAVVRALRPAT